MLKEATFAIMINVFAAAFYTLANLALWSRVNYWVLVNVGSVWSPFFVTSTYLGSTAPPSYSPIYQAIINYPFLLFFFLLIINIILFVRIGKKQK